MGSVGLNSGLQTCKAIALSTEPSFQPRYGFSFGITMKRGHKCESQGYRGIAAALGAASPPPPAVREQRAMHECGCAVA